MKQLRPHLVLLFAPSLILLSGQATNPARAQDLSPSVLESPQGFAFRGPLTAPSINGLSYSPKSGTARTFAAPVWLGIYPDSSPRTTDRVAQGDLLETPVLRLESINKSPNDSSPIYAYHHCNYGGGSPSTNGGCVGLMVGAASETATDQHAGIEAINALAVIRGSNPIQQIQGVELNQFNETGQGSEIQGNGTFTRGPYFGFSSTAGGNAPMMAAFNCQDQSAISRSTGWNHCFFAERWLNDAILVGVPGGGNNSIGLHQVAQRPASPTGNYPAIQIELDDSYFATGSPHPFAIYLGTSLSPGSSPVHCFSVGFTFLPDRWKTCSDGSTSTSGHETVGGGATFKGAIDVPVPNGGVELGSVGSANSPYIDFHSSEAPADYNARIVASGGSASAGSGSLKLLANDVAVSGSKLSLGEAGISWSVGKGAPTGACRIGSLYSNSEGSAGSTLYVCVNGSWVDDK